MRPTRGLFLAALFLLTSCPSHRGDVRTGPPRPALADPGLPALALAPASTTYFIAVRRFSSLADGLRSFIETLRALDASATAERADQELRKDLGVSALQSVEVEDAGLDPSADAALFSTGFSPTFAFKIGDDAKLTKFLADRTKPLTTYMRTHRGVGVTSWVARSDVRASFLRLRGYLLVHYELPTAAPTAKPEPAAKPAPAGKVDETKPEPSFEWLDQIVTAAESGRGPDGLSWALDAAGDRRDVLFFIDPARVAKAAAAMAKSPDTTSCASADAELAKVKRLAAGLGFRPRALRAAAQAELVAPAAKDLLGLLSDGPRLPAALWDKAPARIEWQLDPLAVAGWAKKLSGLRCGPFQEMLSDPVKLLGSLEQNRPVLEHAARALSAALLAADEKGQGTMVLRGAILGRAPEAADRAYLERQLQLQPGEEKIAGQPVRKLGSTLTLAEPAYLAVADGLMKLAAGDGIMAKLLGAQRREPKGNILRADFEPGKLADLRAALKLLDETPGPQPAMPYWFRRRSRGEELDQWAAWLASFARVKVQADFSGESLKLEGEYALR
jgi:hypothetical protein